MYHIKPNGTHSLCLAKTIESCKTCSPEEHFETEDEAKDYVSKKFAKKFGLIKGLGSVDKSSPQEEIINYNLLSKLFCKHGFISLTPEVLMELSNTSLELGFKGDFESEYEVYTYDYFLDDFEVIEALCMKLNITLPETIIYMA